jgi:hypothetical protein
LSSTGGTATPATNVTQLGASDLTSQRFTVFDVSRYLLQILEVTSPGTLFAFSMVFQALVPVDIMVWRPVSDVLYTNMYELIWKMTVSASQLNNTEFVSI